ncbi:acetylcholine receptor subunit delta-like [Gigantopelta aegis]|uniref:acetylcholine receptor subunit delta-like n=1 Tax=Gigantopelta aegis TaxID=1735272 RepID=UPI001B887A4D|nr:acetylcholine receptor subunit delta-like [Gigantopelta aegis]
MFILVVISKTEAKQNTKQILLQELYNSIALSNRTNIPPFTDGGKVIDVTLSVGKPSILQLDNSKQILVSALMLSLWWFDTRMVWNPSQFGNHTLIEFDDSELWTPLVMIENAAADGIDVLKSSLKIVVRGKDAKKRMVMTIMMSTKLVMEDQSRETA